MKQVAYALGRTWTMLSAAAKERLREFRVPCDPPNAIRKGLFAECAHTIGGIGQAVSFAHGPDFLLELAPASIIPLEILGEHTSGCLGRIHESVGICALLQRYTLEMRARGGVPATDGAAASEPSVPDETQAILDSWPIRLPEPSVYAALETAVSNLAHASVDAALWSSDRLRRATVILLSWQGLPLANILKYCPYYNIRCFVFRSDLSEWHFIGAMRQADLGLGLIPIRLRVFQKQLMKVARNLARQQRGGALTDPRATRACRGLQMPGPLSARKIGELLQIYSEPTSPLRRMRPEDVADALKRASGLRSAFYYGSMLASGMLDMLLIPANYYAIEDILRQPFHEARLFDVDGEPWQNPYLPSQNALRREEQRSSILTQLARPTTDSEEPKRTAAPSRKVSRRGPAPTLAQPFCKFREMPLRDWPFETVVQFFGLYMAQHSAKKIVKILEEHGITNPTEMARRILRLLRRCGWLSCGRPLRLIHPEEQATVLCALMDAVRPNPKSASECVVGDVPYPHICRPALAAQGMAFGNRLRESIRSRKDDLIQIGNIRLLHVPGTKSARSNRTLNIDLFAKGPDGPEIVALFIHERERLNPVGKCASEGFVYGDPERSSNADSFAFSAALDECLHRVVAASADAGRADRRPKKSPAVYGRATYHTLRHAAPLRVLQGLLDEGVHLNGDFYGALAELASSLGHNILTLLGSYLGTALLILRWPRRGRFGASVAVRIQSQSPKAAGAQSCMISPTR